MITGTKREILELLGEIASMAPEIRIGQLLAHLGFLGEDQTAKTLWDIEDEQLLAVLHQHRLELAERKSQSAALLSSDKTAQPA
jgi:hypothetical protein